MADKGRSRYLRVYRNDPGFADYLSARHGKTGDAGPFEFRGQTYRFSHSSSDGQGMFDVLVEDDGRSADEDADPRLMRSVAALMRSQLAPRPRETNRAG